MHLRYRGAEYSGIDRAGVSSFLRLVRTIDVSAKSYMHELSIALSIVAGASEEVERYRGSRVHAVHLKVGALAGVVAEALLFSWDISCQGSPLEGSRLVIEEVPVTIFCSQCQAETEAGSIQSLCCSKCGHFSSQVVCGRELEVVALELDEVAETVVV